MPSPEIEEFAKILVQEVRDAAIQSSDRGLRPEAAHAVAKRWRDAAGNSHLELTANVLIPDIVDDTVFHLLRAIDQQVLRLSFTASNGKTVDLSVEGLGELSGWYMGSCTRMSDSLMTFRTLSETTIFGFEDEGRR